MTSTRSKLAMAGVGIAAGALAAGLAPPAEREAAASKPPLFVRYDTKSECTVYPNYPKPGVKGQRLAWMIPAGHGVVWRYNVNSTWAVVTDPGRSKEEFPWWGFTRRSCIGTSRKQTGYPQGISVPTRIQEGRSHVYDSGWRPVEYDQGPESIVRHDVLVRKHGTMRDRANFVVGNVFAGWRVDVTNLKRSDGHWVYVYSASARKWGYVEADKLAL